MDRDQLKQYLKENLDITISVDYKSYQGNHIKVSLLLEGDEISSDRLSISDLGE